MMEAEEDIAQYYRREYYRLDGKERSNYVLLNAIISGYIPMDEIRANPHYSWHPRWLPFNPEFSFEDYIVLLQSGAALDHNHCVRILPMEYVRTRYLCYDLCSMARNPECTAEDILAYLDAEKKEIKSQQELTVKSKVNIVRLLPPIERDKLITRWNLEIPDIFHPSEHFEDILYRDIDRIVINNIENICIDDARKSSLMWTTSYILCNPGTHIRDLLQFMPDEVYESTLRRFAMIVPLEEIKRSPSYRWIDVDLWPNFNGPLSLKRELLALYNQQERYNTNKDIYFLVTNDT